ncbi:hypothetical protein B0T20DRAFT_76893 [Sordaria brevicollis]|uniref:Uncharacterized protein n=1 Tax=Sordaria brevicollis TaxID=83679 RepID=A0AAE0U583_SORBR|nr:hypothetical protein B0T20DRAFT_76893 [Sordaria brevicollis]
MEAPSSFATPAPKRKRPLPFGPTIPNLNQTRTSTGLAGEFTFELRPSNDEDGSKSPRSSVAYRLQHMFLNGGGLGGTSSGAVFGTSGAMAPKRTSTSMSTASQPSLSQQHQSLSQTQRPVELFGFPFPLFSLSRDTQDSEEEHVRPDGSRKRAKIHDRDLDMTGVAETLLRSPASTNNDRTAFEAAGPTSSSSMPPPSTPVQRQSGASNTANGSNSKRLLAPKKGVQFNVDPTGNQHSQTPDNMDTTSDARHTQTPNSDMKIPSSSPLYSVAKVNPMFTFTPTQRPLAPKPPNISMPPPSFKLKGPPRGRPRPPKPAASTSTSVPEPPATVIDPLRASLTWQESEITIYDPDDSDDDGTGINGIGFKPTPEMEHARRMKRKKQLAEYRKREMGDARARRKERRAGADGFVGSGNEGAGSGSNSAVKGRDIATPKSKLKAEKRRVRFMETVTNTVVELPPATVPRGEDTVMEGVTKIETAAAVDVVGGTGGVDGGGGGGGNTVESGMAGAGADLAAMEA